MAKKRCNRKIKKRGIRKGMMALIKERRNKQNKRN